MTGRTVRELRNRAATDAAAFARHTARDLPDQAVGGRKAVHRMATDLGNPAADMAADSGIPVAGTAIAEAPHMSLGYSRIDPVPDNLASADNPEAHSPLLQQLLAAYSGSPQLEDLLTRTDRSIRKR